MVLGAKPAEGAKAAADARHAARMVALIIVVNWMPETRNHLLYRFQEPG
jgi:hypothetical protein